MASARRRRAPRTRLAGAAARLVDRERVARAATSGAGGQPHVVPVCHVVDRGRVYFASGTDGRKVLNLAANPRLALVVDIYTEDWKRLAGVLIQGDARLVPRGPDFRRARRLLYAKYPQYATEAALDESDSVVVELRPRRVFTWGLA